MHSFWFALQRNGFILNPPNPDAFFSSLLIKIPYSGFPSLIFCVPYRIQLTLHTNANFFCKQHLSPQIYFLTLYRLFTLVD